jgi:hypothetical protein
MAKYKINDIIDNETGEQVEDRNRLKRIGTIVEELFPFTVGDQAQFVDSDYKIIRTSTVYDISSEKSNGIDYVFLKTKNSLYVLKKIEDK